MKHWIVINSLGIKSPVSLVTKLSFSVSNSILITVTNSILLKNIFFFSTQAKET